MLTHEASGGMVVAGCAGIKLQRKYAILFPPNSKAYIKRNSKFGGKIEYVVIKKANKHFPNNSEESGVQPDIIYLDTNNRIWTEDEFVTQEQALILAADYWEKMKKISHDLFKNCVPVKP